MTLWSEPPDRVAPRRGEVHVWRLRLDPDARRLVALEEILSPDEVARARRFRFRELREHFIAARGQLRQILAAYTGGTAEGIRFRYGARGKPYLDGDSGGVRFNLAHSGEIALAAVTLGAEIGVDIERIRPEIAREPLAERFFSGREVASLQAVPSAEREAAFFRCWTRKEAFLKAHGAGIAFGLDRFSVSLAPGERTALTETPFDPEEKLRWEIVHIDPAPGYLGALAVRRPVGSICYWEFAGR